MVSASCSGELEEEGEEGKNKSVAEHWRLTPVILAIWEAEIGRITVGKQPGQIFITPYLENTQCKKGLAEWLKW
jgi:hypothetical protein